MNDDLNRNQPENRPSGGQTPPASGAPGPEGDLSSYEQKRQEKVQQFQLNLQDDDLEPVREEPLQTVPADIPLQSEQSSNDLVSHSGQKTEEIPAMLTKEEKKARREAKKAEKKRRKKKAKKNGCLFKIVWFIMIALVSVVLAQYILVGVNDMLAINRPESTVTVDIPSECTLDEVADILAEKHVVDRPNFFKLYATLTRSAQKRAFTKGTFEMKTNMDYEAIINFIQTRSNRKDTVEITFYEGETIQQFAQKLEENNVCKAEAFLEACNSDDFDDDYPFLKEITNKDKRYYKLEGYLFPDTYDFYEEEPPEDPINRFLSNYNRKVYKKQKVKGYDEPMSIEDLALEKGMTTQELLTLASMVQAEAADEDDMKKVAGVFLNRLEFGQQYDIYTLDSDPTVFYPYKKSTAPKGFVSTYSTYDNQGLPLGPICNPGLSAIKAVLNPDTEKNLYFCHGVDKNGNVKALYAKTAYQHKQNLRALGLDVPGE